MEAVEQRAADYPGDAQEELEARHPLLALRLRGGGLEAGGLVGAVAAGEAIRGVAGDRQGARAGRAGLGWWVSAWVQTAQGARAAERAAEGVIASPSR